MNAKRKAFSKYQKKIGKKESSLEVQMARIKKYCTVVRAICSTQMNLLSLLQKKNHVIEIQINGGSTDQKVDFAYNLFEKEIKADSVFKNHEMIDIIGVTKGKGTAGVMKRFGVTHLRKKSHRGYRKVGCIGAWHPSRVRWSVARRGQLGFHHRTEMNKKVYRMGKSIKECPNNASTMQDLTEKAITPLGGFPHYGVVRNDFIMIKGCCVGPRKRIVLLRKSLFPQTKRAALAEVNVKFIDTASKLGHGRFQT